MSHFSSALTTHSSHRPPWRTQSIPAGWRTLINIDTRSALIPPSPTEACPRHPCSKDFLRCNVERSKSGCSHTPMGHTFPSLRFGYPLPSLRYSCLCSHDFECTGAVVFFSSVQVHSHFLLIFLMTSDAFAHPTSLIDCALTFDGRSNPIRILFTLYPLLPCDPTNPVLLPSSARVLCAFTEPSLLLLEPHVPHLLSASPPCPTLRFCAMAMACGLSVSALARWIQIADGLRRLTRNGRR